MADRYRPSKTIMRRFRIDELSAVDKPAQERATAVLCKRADGSEHRVDIRAKVFGKLTPDERSKINQPILRDDETTKLLNLRQPALTFSEAEFMASLEGDDRRAFVLADHDVRAAKMAANKPNQKEPDMLTFADLPSAAAHYAGTGMTKTAAMSFAARSHPELYDKHQAQPAAVAKAARAEADTVAKGIARRRRVEALVHSTMTANKCGRVLALQKVRADHPDLFA